SVVLIEHHLDLIDVADWVIDLGPEGGDAGGAIVAAGTPDDITTVASSRTGQALARHRAERARLAGTAKRSKRSKLVDRVAEAPPSAVQGSRGSIDIVHAREHNLKNVDVTIPRDRLTVITGVSGSGKSTVAFDILFAEGQRRYLESLNAYARQF